MRFGVIEKSGPTGVVTPKMSKGMGWKVKLTCNSTSFGDLQGPRLQSDLFGEVGQPIIKLVGGAHPT